MVGVIVIFVVVVVIMGFVVMDGGKIIENFIECVCFECLKD